MGSIVIPAPAKKADKSTTYTKTEVDNKIQQSTANKAAHFESGVFADGSNTEAIGKAWDAITIYGKTVVGTFNHAGVWMYIAYKYSGSQYGMMLAISYNTFPSYRLNVINGQKLYFTLDTTQVT